MGPLADSRRALFAFLVVAAALFLVIVFFQYQILTGMRLEESDRSLREQARQLSDIVVLFRQQDYPQHRIATLLGELIERSPRKTFVDIKNSDRSLLYTNFADDPATASLPAHASRQPGPETVQIGQNRDLRLQAYSLNDLRLVLGSPLPTTRQLLLESLSNSLSMLPVLALFVAGMVFWYHVRHVRPTNELTKYLNMFLDQPLQNSIVTPPKDPRGSMNTLLKTVSRVVTRLHLARNQALQYSSFASHELRNNLSILRSHLEHGLDTGTKSLRKTVVLAYDETLRLSRVVEDLLMLSTMHAGTFRLQLQEVDLEKFLKAFYDEALLLTRPQKISVVLKKGPTVRLIADPLRLNQVFFNLLENAVKHTRSGNRIRISYVLEDHDVVIRFTDTGRGIGKEELPYIFEPFYQGTDGKAKRNGTGLGLSLIKWIITLHKGSVEVESRLGEWTTFVIRLPMVNSKHL